MLKNVSTKSLILLFGGLLLLYIGSEWYSSKKGDRTYREYFVKVDSSQVDKLILTPNRVGREITLTKEKGGWRLNDGALNTPADQASITNLISSLTEVKNSRLATSKKDLWKKYQVNDSLGSRAKIYSGSELIADIYFGKFSFNQETRSGQSYVRMANENQVFATEGFLSSSFNPTLENLRDRTILKGTKENWTSLKFDYKKGDSFSLVKNINGDWAVDNVIGDSTKLETYFNRMQSILCNNFVEGFVPSQDKVVATLTLSGNNMKDDIVITEYEGPVNAQVVISSSLNPEAYFDGIKLDIRDQIFKLKTDF